jgi:hypothetical protein
MRGRGIEQSGPMIEVADWSLPSRPTRFSGALFRAPGPRASGYAIRLPASGRAEMLGEAAAGARHLILYLIRLTALMNYGANASASAQRFAAPLPIRSYPLAMLCPTGCPTAVQPLSNRFFANPWSNRPTRIYIGLDGHPSPPVRLDCPTAPLPDRYVIARTSGSAMVFVPNLVGLEEPGHGILQVF